MKYKNTMKMRIATMTAYAVIGAVLSVLSYTGIIENDFVRAFGIALFLCGIVKAVRYGLIMRDTEKMQKIEVAEKDERNIMLYEKARSLAFAAFITMAGIAVIVLYILNMTLAGLIVAYTVCGYVLLYWICYMIVKGKY